MSISVFSVIVFPLWFIFAMRIFNEFARLIRRWARLLTVSYTHLGQNTTRRQKDDYASDARIAEGKEKFIEKIFFAVAKEQYGRGAHQEKRLLEHDSKPQKNAV